MDMIQVVSFNALFPRRVHYMDEDGMVLCGNIIHCRIWGSRPDTDKFVEGVCQPCRAIYNFQRHIAEIEYRRQNPLPPHRNPNT